MDYQTNGVYKNKIDFLLSHLRTRKDLGLATRTPMKPQLLNPYK